MGFTADEPVTAGTVLIIEQVESQNYSAGSTGWVIKANGDAEFNDVTVRGTLEVVDATTHGSVVIQNISNNPQIDFTPGDWSPAANPANAAKLSGAILTFPNTAPSSSPMPTMFIDSPSFTATDAAEIQLDGEPFDGSRNPQIKLQSSGTGDVDVTITGGVTTSGTVNDAYGFQDTVYYTANGSFTKASFPKAKKLRVRMAGGGGGGGGAAINAAGTNSSAGGGGAGAYAESWIDVAGLAAVTAVTVGTAGTGGAAGSTGGAGGGSSFGALVTANGGNGGGGGGSAATWFNIAGGAAQATATGDLTLPGGAGYPGSRNGASYVAGQQIGGNGGANLLGQGGQGTNNATGSAGNRYGGGGGAASASQSTGGFAGGAGAAGIVIVDIYG